MYTDFDLVHRYQFSELGNYEDRLRRYKLKVAANPKFADVENWGPSAHKYVREIQERESRKQQLVYNETTMQFEAT